MADCISDSLLWFYVITNQVKSCFTFNTFNISYIVLLFGWNDLYETVTYTDDDVDIVENKEHEEKVTKARELLQDLARTEAAKVNILRVKDVVGRDIDQEAAEKRRRKIKLN